MSAAPLTPPPNSSAEVQDQTGAPIASTSSTTATSPTQDGYPLGFPIIVGYASKAQYRELTQFAEEADILNSNVHLASRLFIVSPLVLSYLILDSIPPAQHALARLPDNVASSPLARALSNLVNATAERKYSKIYSRAESLFHLVSQPGFIEEKLASLIANLVTSFAETFRERTFILLSKAFTSLPLALAEIYLGLPGDQIVRVAEQQGWKYSASSRIFEPKVISKPFPRAFSKSTTSSLSTFEFIANSVGELET